MDMAEHICDEVHRNGFDKLVLLRGHGGNVFLGEAFVRRMLERDKPYAVYSIPVKAGIGKETKALMETEVLGHAREFETSLNMASCPELVNLKALGKKTFKLPSPPKVGSAITTVDWIAQHPEMAKGESQKATKEKGDKIAELWANSIIKHLRLIKRDKIAPREVKRCARQARSIGKEKA